MKKITSVFLFLFLASFAFGQTAKKIVFNPGQTGFEISNLSNSGFQFSATVASVTAIGVDTEKGGFVELRLKNYAKSYDLGNPDLPVLNQIFEIPQDASVEIKILSYEEIDYQLADFEIANRVMPAQPSLSKNEDPADAPFYFNQEIYAADQFTGHEIVKTQILGMMRGVRMARLSVSPFRYNPVTNTLKVLHNLQVEIKFNHANISKTNYLKNKYYSPYFKPAFKNVIQSNTEMVNIQYPVKYVIVADPDFETALQPFIQWKTKMGYTVVEAYTNMPEVGTTTTSIKAYLEGLYTGGTPSDPAPSFILFVGDVAQIPAWSGTTGSHVSDLYYCTYDGAGDIYPDVNYGRFSANTVAELQPQIDKTLEYERYLMPDPSYLNEVILVAGVDGTFAPTHGNGQINYVTTYYCNAAHGLTPYTYLYEDAANSTVMPSSDAGASASIIQHISDGVGFGNYTAHCSSSGWADPSFVNSDVPGLENDSEYGVLIGNCCLSVKFDDASCFGETLLRAVNKGAVAYIGGSNSTLWDEDYYWGVGFGAVVVNPTYEATGLGSYDALHHEHSEATTDWALTASQLNVAGNLAVTESGSSNETYYWEIYHLMGDPSLMPYMGVPAAIAASYTEPILIGVGSLTVTTEAGAYVALSRNGVLYDAAEANDAGVAVLNFTPFTSPGMADIVITKQFRQPYIEQIEIIPNSGPYVVLDSYSISDVTGNGNGQADFGELININADLENVGSDPAVNVQTTLSTTDTYVTLSTSTHNFGNIASGATASATNAYSFIVNNFVPDQHEVQFNLAIGDDSGENWNSTMMVMLNAPNLDVVFTGIDDLTGNNNGRLDPSEDITLKISALNNGHADAVAATCILTSTSPYITINDNLVNLTALLAGTSTPAEFGITVADDAPIGETVAFTFNLTAGSYTAQLTVYQKVGLLIEDFETGDYSMYPWLLNGSPWVITDAVNYNGTYSSRSGTIDHNGSSEMYLDINVLANDHVSFYRKVSSESGYDKLKFYIDTDLKGEWSGEQDWGFYEYTVTAGNHTLKWVYSKDGSVSNGADAAWVDDIILPAFTMPNRPPAFSSTPIESGMADQLYTYSITASDPDFNALTITCPTMPTWLTFVDNGNGTAKLEGTPALSDLGANAVVLQVTDGQTAVNQSFTITITEFNNLPTSSAGSVTIDEDNDHDFTLSNFAFNDLDTNDELAGIKITVLETRGYLYLDMNNDGKINGGESVSLNQEISRDHIANLKFKPIINGNGDSYSEFKFKVFDGTDYSVNEYNMNINVLPINDRPVIVGQDYIEMDEDLSWNLLLQHLVISDPDNPDQSNFQISIQCGRNYLCTEGTTIVPVANFNGDLLVFISVNDGIEESEVYSLHITVNPVNDLPEITGQAKLSTNEDVEKRLYVSDLSFSDPDNDAGYALKIQNGENYSHVGDFIYPAQDFNGDLSIPVAINDGTGDSDLYYLKVTVYPVNDAPKITAQESISIQEDTDYELLISKLTVSDVDNAIEDCSLQIQNGTNYTYVGQTITPAADFNGTLYVDVTATDGSDASAVFTVEIEVTPVNDAPLLAGQSAISTPEDTAKELKISMLTLTDVDTPDQTNFSISVQDGDNYTHTGNTITPAADFNGTLSVNATASDGTTESAVFQIAVDVIPINDAPSFDGQSTLSTAEETAISLSLSDLTTSDVDNDAGDISLFLMSGSNYSLTGSDITPANDFNGELQVRAKLFDGETYSDMFYISVSVTPVNDLPVFAGQNTLNTEEDTALTIQLSDLQVTDVDNTAAELNILIQNGTNYTYSGATIQPDENFNGELTVVAKIADTEGETAAFNLTVSVSPVNDAPIVANAIGNKTATEDVAYQFTAAADVFTDVDDNTLNYSAKLENGDPLPTWLSFSASTRTFSGTPENEHVGVLSVAMIAKDAAGDEAQSVFALTVANVNDAPVVNNNIADQEADILHAFSFTFAENTFLDVDADDQLTYTAKFDGGNLPAWLNFNASTRTFSGTPTSDNDKGDYSVQVIATDESGETATEEFGLSVKNATGIETMSSVEFKMYPNPTGGIVNISFKEAAAAQVVLKLRNINGKLLDTQEISTSKETQIDLSNYPAGVYFLHFESKDMNFTKRVVVK